MIKKFQEFLLESKKTVVEIGDFIKKNEKHFAAFLKPKQILVSVKDEVCTIKPGSNSFTIDIDFKNKIVNSTGKPNSLESTSYVEIMEYIRKETSFEIKNAGY